MSNSLIFGRRAQGKSTLAFSLAQLAGLSIVVFDVNAQFGCVPPDAVLTNPDDFELFLTDPPGSLVAYRPESDVEEEFTGFADLLWPRHGYTLIIDEASQIQSPGRAHPRLDRLVRMGSRQGVNLIQALHRPTDAATICRSLARHWYVFRSRQQTDLDVIAERCGPAVAETAGALGEHEYVHWDDDREVSEVVKDAGSWFVDIDAAPQVEPEGEDENASEQLPTVRDALTTA